MVTSVVTGGSGFVGRHLVKALLARGDLVKVVDVGLAPDICSNSHKAKFIKTDITDKQALAEAFKDADCVFHVASVVHTKQNQTEFIWKVNHGGTINVIDVCKEKKIPKLIYISSGSVVYEGQDIENGTESLPYSSISQAPYADSKIEAERAVLAASDDRLATVALRPHVIFGPEDTRFLPALLKNAKKGKLRFKIGLGKWLSDFTYIDNLIDACLAAEERLQVGSKVSGQAYFITNGEPMGFFEFVQSFLSLAQLPPMLTAIPHQPILALAYINEWFDTYIRGGTLTAEDGFTPFAIKYLCTHHYFSIEKARKDLEYVPKVSIQEGIRLSVDYLKDKGNL